MRTPAIMKSLLPLFSLYFFGHFLSCTISWTTRSIEPSRDLNLKVLKEKKLCFTEKLRVFSNKQQTYEVEFDKQEKYLFEKYKFVFNKKFYHIKPEITMSGYDSHNYKYDSSHRTNFRERLISKFDEKGYNAKYTILVDIDDVVDLKLKREIIDEMNKILKTFKEDGNQFASNLDDSIPVKDNSCKLIENKSQYLKLGIFGEDLDNLYSGEGCQRFFEKVFTYKIKSGFKDFLENSVRDSLYRRFELKHLQLILIEEKESFCESQIWIEQIESYGQRQPKNYLVFGTISELLNIFSLGIIPYYHHGYGGVESLSILASKHGIQVSYDDYQLRSVLFVPALGFLERKEDNYYTDFIDKNFENEILDVLDKYL